MLDDLNLYASLESKITKEMHVKVDSAEFMEMPLEGMNLSHRLKHTFGINSYS